MKYNIRKIIFTLRFYEGESADIVVPGRLNKKRIFGKRYVILPNPEEIIKNWNKIGFVKIGKREFIDIKKIERINYKTVDHFIDK